MSENKKIAKSVGKISLATFLSRILGLLRDMLRAYYFGTSIAADAFTVAFRIPNLLRELLGEGTMSAAFVPVYTEYLTKKTKAEAIELAQSVMGLLSIIVGAITLLGMVFTPQLVLIMAKGFTLTPGKYELTVSLTQILFPYIFFVSLAALIMGILNSHREFFIPALAPISLNLLMIGGMVGFARFLGKMPQQQIYGLAIGALLGGVAQLIWQLPSLKKKGIPLFPKFNFKHPGVIKILRLIVPRIFGMAVREINILVDTFLAALLVTGSVAALEYGSRLMMLPLGMFGVAIGTAVLPTLSAQASQKDYPALKKTLSFAIRLIFLIMIPASLNLIVMRKQIILLLLQRGHFDIGTALPLTAQALLFYSIGLVAFGLIKAVVPVFYALQDTKTPVKVSAIAMVTNVILNVILMQHLQLGGLALASSISAMINVTLLLWMLYRKIGNLDGKKIFICLVKLLISGFVMAFIMLVINYYLDKISTPAITFKLIAVFIPLFIGGGAFVLSASVLRLEELKDIIKIFREKFA